MTARRLTVALVALAACSSDPPPEGTPDAGPPGPTPEVCSGYRDEDGDGEVDCADPDCAGDPACPVCGDGAVGNGEECDGPDLAGLGCADLGYHTGVLACDADCLLDATGCGYLETCGNGLDDDGDGDTDCADDACIALPACGDCGDLVRNGSEACDGPDLAGTTCAALGFDGGELACGAACVFDVSGCAGSGEDCANGVDDDLDGDADCQDLDCRALAACAVCGDGVLAVGEGCDDGNTTAGDCCSAACAPETAGCEIEPNDDLASAGDLVALPIATVNGAIRPAGDRDVFRVTVPAAAVSPRIVAQVLDGPAGTTCASLLIDSLLELRDGAGSLVATDDDAGPGYCSLLTQLAVSPGDYFVTVRASDFAPFAVFDYVLSVAVLSDESCFSGADEDGDGAIDCADPDCRVLAACAVCGDRVTAVTEQCDDGNLVAGDCCDSGCALEAGCEVEPNDDSINANDLFSLAPGGTIGAAIEPEGESDVFRVTIPSDVLVARIDAQILDGLRGTTCASGGIDSHLELLDGAGFQIAAHDDGGANCSAVSLDALVPGDYYVRVTASSAAVATTFDYQLVVTVTASDAPGELEPNDDAATANGPFLAPSVITGAISPAGDEDWFLIDVYATTDLVIRGGGPGGPTTCGIDLALDLFSFDTVLATSPSPFGGTGCGLLDPGSAPVMGRIPPGAYHVRARSWSGGVIAGYTIEVAQLSTCGDYLVEGLEECDEGGDGGFTCSSRCERIPVCGDGFVDSPETCEDGNTIDGDGCSGCFRDLVCGDSVVMGSEQCDDGGSSLPGCDDFCQAEPGHAYETEPNDDGTPGIYIDDFSPFPSDADGPFGADVVVHGAIAPPGDDDYYAVTNPGAAPVTVRLETFGDVVGSCFGHDTELYVKDAAGSVLAYADDGGVGPCSRIDFSLAAGETVYVRVIEKHDDDGFPYLLEIDFP